MKSIYSLLLFLSLSVSVVVGQHPVSTCGFDDRLRQQLVQDPGLQQRLDANEATIQAYVRKARQSRQRATLYTIPVVFHIIHTGGAIGTEFNPSDAAINLAVSDLNDRFTKSLATSGGANIEIRFALATRGPDCNPTTGINRVDGRVVPGYEANGIGNPGADERAVKNLSRWSNKDYVNIWVVHKVDGSTSGSNYAYYPGASPEVDGIVQTALVFNFRDGNASLLAHEMGHHFNLAHTFEGDNGGTSCPANTDCNNDGDKVCDTEPHIRRQCVTVPTLNSCTGSNYLIADAAFNYTVLNNYMNYASNSCTNLFTEGQKTRIRAALDGPRASLKNGNGFMANTLNNLSSAITATSFAWVFGTTYSACASRGVTLSAQSPAFATYQWQKDGLDIPGATANAYTTTVAGTYQLVQTVCGTSSATTSNQLPVRIYSTPASASISAPGTRLCTGSTLTLTAKTDDYAYDDKYQWYKDDAPIAGATGSTYNATTNGTYKFVATRCGGSVTSADMVISVGPPPVAACSPTFTNSPGGYHGLMNFTMGGINATSGTSGADGANYVDRTCVYIATVAAGAPIPFSVKTSNSSWVKLYLDRNNDGNFVEVASVQATGGTSSSVSSSFTLPANTLINTALRLRVGVSPTFYGTASMVTACGLNEKVDATFGSGQIEDFALVVTGSLPVDLLGFTARKTANSTVALQWATTTETTNRLFQVERSRDLLRFDRLATIPGRGTTTTRTDYAYTDEQPYPGQNYYRLVQVDVDGSEQLYRPVAVFVEAPLTQLTVWPNPSANKSFTISQTGLAGADIRVLDILGRPVSFQTDAVSDDQRRISLTGQPVGTYIVQVRQGATQQTVQVLIN